MKTGEKLTIVRGTHGYVVATGWTQESNQSGPREHHHFTTYLEAMEFVRERIFPDLPEPAATEGAA